MGAAIPTAVSHAPLPSIPYFPRAMNNPVVAKRIKEMAYISEIMGHHFPGL